VDWENAIIWFVVFLVSVTLHEASHALFALLGGDRTAYLGGQVTLNPLPHIQREPVGMLLVPLVSLLLSNGTWCFGFASTPIDRIWAYHHPRKASLMSAAGPLSNLLLAAIAFAVLWFVGRADSGTEEAVIRIAHTFLRLNLILFFFNLIPVPPLDGAGVVKGLARPLHNLYERLETVPYIGVVAFLVANWTLPHVYLPVYREVMTWLR
jgi:Zn-dependent protease